MSKKVLIFESYPFFSGAQRITLNVCKILKKNGFHVTLLSVDDRFGNIKKHFSKHVDAIESIKAHKVLLKYGDEDSWFTKSTFLKSLFVGLLPFYVRSIFKINFKNYDYLYCCDPRGATMMLAAATLFRKASILHFHGRNRLPKIMAKTILKIFTQTLCVSNDVLKSLPDSSRKKILYNGIDFSQYEDDINTESIQSEADILLNDNSLKYNRFLYAGVMRPHKGVHRLVYSFVKYLRTDTNSENSVLFLCGAAKSDAEVAFQNYLKDFCEDNGVSDRVFWMGWRSDILAWMNFADYFVFPTVDKEKNAFDGFGEQIESTEGLPTVLIESSICKVFNLAADVTGVREIITDNHNGIVYENDGSIENLYELLMKVGREKPHYSGFPNREKFDLDTFASELMKVFCTV